jgi:NADH:ubiquinone oxidoreductase subunit B-like Fe-S oxidoreductase
LTIQKSIPYDNHIKVTARRSKPDRSIHSYSYLKNKISTKEENETEREKQEKKEKKQKTRRAESRSQE